MAPTLLRKLSHNEAYQLAMYVLDQYRGTSVSCRYQIPPELVGPGSGTRSELVRTVEAAVIEVVLKHPVLQVGIVNADSKRPTWVQLDSLDLRNHLNWHFMDDDASKDLEMMAQETTASEVDGVFPDLPNRPGWRITILHQKMMIEVFFTWNHPHCDGISGKIFQEDLARALNTRKGNRSELHRQDTSKSSIIKLPLAPPNLPPPIEDACKLPLSVGYTLKMIWEELGPASFSWTRSNLARWAPYQLSPYKTQFRAFTVAGGHDALSKILSSCGKHKTTLTGLLHSLTLVSLAAHLSETVATAFESGTTVDLRRFLASNSSIQFDLPPERTMGNYVTIMAHIFDELLVKKTRSKLPADTGHALSQDCMDHIWTVASTVRGEIEQKLERGLKNDVVGAMKFVGDWREQMTNSAKRPRQFSWWVTGVGVLDWKGPQAQDGPWIVRRAQFALSTETTAAALMISPMTAAGQQLCVGATWQDSVIEVSLGERIVADLESWLAQVAAQ